MPRSPVTRAMVGRQLNGGTGPRVIIVVHAARMAALPRSTEAPLKTASSARKAAKRSGSRAAIEAAKASSVCHSERSAAERVAGGGCGAAGLAAVAVGDAAAAVGAVAAGLPCGLGCSAIAPLPMATKHVAAQTATRIQRRARTVDSVVLMKIYSSTLHRGPRTRAEWRRASGAARRAA